MRSANAVAACGVAMTCRITSAYGMLVSHKAPLDGHAWNVRNPCTSNGKPDNMIPGRVSGPAFDGIASLYSGRRSRKLILKILRQIIIKIGWL
jgi:hypothetical protein